jgi:hypothetical protein
MLTLSIEDTSAYTKGVSLLIKLGMKLVLAIIFSGKVSQEMYSIVHSITMVGKVVLKVH